MRDLLLWLNVAVLALIAGIAGRYLWLMQHGYCLSLYRPD